MNRTPIRVAWAVVLAAALAAPAAAQRPGGGDRGNRGERVRPPDSIPAIESYAPMTTSVFEVLAVRPADRVVRLRGRDGRAADVHVQEHVFDVTRLKPGDKVKVDFFQPDEGDARLRAAGLWPAP
jgi:hypothetical protein